LLSDFINSLPTRFDNVRIRYRRLIDYTAIVLLFDCYMLVSLKKLWLRNKMFAKIA